VNPYWIDDLDSTPVKDGTVDFLSGAELTFWRELIAKYLKPIDKDPKKEVRLMPTYN
jgi:chitin synthase